MTNIKNRDELTTRGSRLTGCLKAKQVFPMDIACSECGLHEGGRTMINARAISNLLLHGGIQFVSITEELMRFRQLLEHEADKPIHEIEVNAAELLSDLVLHLRLGVKQHDQILGQLSVDYLDAVLETKISIPIRH